MVVAREAGEGVGAEFAGGWGRVAGGEEGFGELVGARGVDEMDVRVRRRGQHRRDRAPTGRDDREVVGERLDQGERLGFVRVGGGVAEDVGGGEERVFLSFVGETDVADDVGAERDDLGEKSVLIRNRCEAAGDGEAKGVGFAAVRDGDGSEEIEKAFFAGAEAEVEQVRGSVCWGFELDVWSFREVEAVGDDGGAAGREVLGVGEKLGREDDRKIGAAEEEVSEGALEGGGVMHEPVAESDGVPVENKRAKERATEEHHDPVAVERGTFAGGGDVVERHRTVAESDGDRAEAGGEEGKELGEAGAADVGRIAGKADVDVMKCEMRRDGKEMVEKGLDHQALAMHGGRRVGEDEEVLRSGRGHGEKLEELRSKIQAPSSRETPNSNSQIFGGRALGDWNWGGGNGSLALADERSGHECAGLECGRQGVRVARIDEFGFSAERLWQVGSGGGVRGGGVFGVSVFRECDAGICGYGVGILVVGESVARSAGGDGAWVVGAGDFGVGVLAQSAREARRRRAERGDGRWEMGPSRRKERE